MNTITQDIEIWLVLLGPLKMFQNLFANSLQDFAIHCFEKKSIPNILLFFRNSRLALINLEP